MNGVRINLKTNSLGDTMGAVAQVDRFQRIKNCNVGFYINPKYVDILKKTYPKISFNPENFEFHEEKDIHFLFDRPLQKGFSDELGLTDYVESRPRVYVPDDSAPLISKKYITISTQSTHQARYWNNSKGWDNLIKYLKNKYGISVVCIDQFDCYGVRGIINKVPAKAINRCGVDLKSCINYINHGLFHVGTSNGLCWLAHACGKHVVLISNVTKAWCEFTEDITRIYNETVCHGCLNEEPFDPDNWMWCPRKKNFECTKKISFEDIRKKIDECVIARI